MDFLSRRKILLATRSIFKTPPSLAAAYLYFVKNV